MFEGARAWESTLGWVHRASTAMDDTGPQGRLHLLYFCPRLRSIRIDRVSTSSTATQEGGGVLRKSLYSFWLKGGVWIPSPPVIGDIEDPETFDVDPKLSHQGSLS